MEGLAALFCRLVEERGVLWLVGQGLGVVAIVLGFLSYQMKTKGGLLFMQSAVAVTFCLHYLFIGAYSGMVVNVLNVVRNFVYDKRTKRGVKSRWVPLLFVALQVALCVFAWDDWYSVFILTGIAINTYCMSLENPQTVRKSILITSPMVLLYDLFAGSVGGSIYETVAIVSAAIGIFRNRK